MLKDEKKIKSNLGVSQLKNRLLRLLKSEIGFQISLAITNRKDLENVYEQPQKEIDNALAEAEYHRAKATMTAQQVRTYC